MLEKTLHILEAAANFFSFSTGLQPAVLSCKEEGKDKLFICPYNIGNNRTAFGTSIF